MAITTYNFSASTTITKDKEKEKEQRWVDQVSKKFIREVAIDISDANPICVFNIPGSISIFKPEAYLPHLIALGPYHHMDPNLYHMQRYKISSAKSCFYDQTPHSNKNIRDSLINKLKQLDPVVRGCYHSYLDLDDNTLSWIVAIDGLFLVHLLQQEYYFFAGGDLQNKHATTILSRDLLLLENQIPFVVLRQIYRSINNNPSEDQSADDELLLMMERFCRANSPLQFMSSISPNERISPLHLLDLMYHLIINNNINIANSPHQIQDEVINIESQTEEESEESSEVVASADEEGMNSACDNIGEITEVAMKFGLAIKILKPVQVIQNIPWDKILTIIGLKTVNDNPGKLDEGRPVVEEIKIPSVSSLNYYAGITFRSTSEGIRGIKFEEEEAALYLPQITLDVNSEVIFRNLVAYETAMNYSTSTGYLSFSEFVDLISGIIDNAEDAKLLKEKGIVKGDLTNDQIAELFNGMNRAASWNSGNKKTSVVKKINNYYKKRVVVKMFKFMKKRWLSLLKVFTHVLTVLLLLLLVLYSFCVFYGCPKLFGSSG